MRSHTMALVHDSKICVSLIVVGLFDMVVTHRHDFCDVHISLLKFLLLLLPSEHEITIKRRLGTSNIVSSDIEFELS